MDRDSVVVGGIYRTTDVTTCDLTYEPGSIVKVIELDGVGCNVKLLFGARQLEEIIPNSLGFVYLEELEEIE